MVKRILKSDDNEPEQKKFEIPSEREHLFQVVDVIETIDSDPEIIHVKCEVVGGDEAGRTLLKRLSLDGDYKGFFATRLFLKAVDLPHKGEFVLDTDEWTGRQFYATVEHSSDGYANIKEYNFDKKIDQPVTKATTTIKEPDVAWDDDM